MRSAALKASLFFGATTISGAKADLKERFNKARNVNYSAQSLSVPQTASEL